jgi:hypothetical protein
MVLLSQKKIVETNMTANEASTFKKATIPFAKTIVLPSDPTMKKIPPRIINCAIMANQLTMALETWHPKPEIRSHFTSAPPESVEKTYAMYVQMKAAQRKTVYVSDPYVSAVLSISEYK